jgi:hypothetical protein
MGVMTTLLTSHSLYYWIAERIIVEVKNSLDEIKKAFVDRHHFVLSGA